MIDYNNAQWKPEINGNELSVSSKCRELFELMRKCWLLQKDSPPWTYLLFWTINNEKSVDLYTKSRKSKYTTQTVYHNITVYHFVLEGHRRLATEMGSNRETSEANTNYTKYYNERLELADCVDVALWSRDCSTSWPSLCCTQDSSQHCAQPEHACTSIPASSHCSQLAVRTIFRIECQV